jgi:exodeoxyribonuclease VIII
MNETATKKQDSGPMLGIFDDISNEDYHASNGISKSGLDKIALSPEHYQTARKHPKPSIPAWVVGTALHTIILEPDDFDNRYVMEPPGAPPRPTATQLKAAKPTALALDRIMFWEEFDAENEGKIVLSTKPGDDPFWKPSDWCMVHRMRDAILMHETASILLDPTQGKAEQSIYWLDKDNDYGVREPTHRLCKARPDFINYGHNLMIDLKTTADASYTGFRQSVSKWRYFVQDPWYTSGYYQATGQAVQDFIFVAVEKQPPYGIGIYKLGLQEKRAGRSLMLRDLDTYSECMKSGDWPAYPPDIRDLELSPWQLAGNIS